VLGTISSTPKSPWKLSIDATIFFDSADWVKVRTERPALWSVPPAKRVKPVKARFSSGPQTSIMLFMVPVTWYIDCNTACTSVSVREAVAVVLMLAAGVRNAAGTGRSVCAAGLEIQLPNPRVR
jgi:hypothetical protein